jgi:hypothetical protein
VGVHGSGLGAVIVAVSSQVSQNDLKFAESKGPLMQRTYANLYAALPGSQQDGEACITRMFAIFMQCICDDNP